MLTYASKHSFLTLSLTLALAACSGSRGIAGLDGEPGEQGADGPAGPEGARGERGPAGADGSSCSVEDNGDGSVTITCDDGTTATLHDGADGQDGMDGQNGDAGPPGTSCTVADNGDGTKTISCEDGTMAVVTDGADALQALIAVDPETAGANCADGGQRVQSGIDDNGDGTLDPGEVDSTVYVCDGADGATGADGNDGLNSLVEVTAEAPGSNCANGGQRVDVGVDDNGDGALQGSEIDNTAYVCNGVSPILLDLTPATGTLVETDDPFWPNKGYRFTATRDFVMTGAEWWLTLPVGGTVTARVYDSTGTELAVGSGAPGNGTEMWYRSDLTFAFTGGQSYTVSFHNDRAETSLFDRKNSPTYDYAVDSTVSNVHHYSGGTGGDNQPVAYPTSSNSWAPFQRLIITP